MLDIKYLEKEELIEFIEEAIRNNEEVLIWEHKWKKIYMKVK